MRRLALALGALVAVLWLTWAARALGSDGTSVRVHVGRTGDAAQFRTVVAVVANRGPSPLILLWPIYPDSEVPLSTDDATIRIVPTYAPTVQMRLLDDHDGVVEVPTVATLVLIAPETRLRMIDDVQFSADPTRGLHYCWSDRATVIDWGDADGVLTGAMATPAHGKLRLVGRPASHAVAETALPAAITFSGLTCDTVQPKSPPFPMSPGLQLGDYLPRPH